MTAYGTWGLKLCVQIKTHSRAAPHINIAPLRTSEVGVPLKRRDLRDFLAPSCEIMKHTAEQRHGGRAKSGLILRRNSS